MMVPVPKSGCGIISAAGNRIKKNGIITQNNFDVFDGLSQS